MRKQIKVRYFGGARSRYVSRGQDQGHVSRVTAGRSLTKHTLIITKRLGSRVSRADM